MKRFTCRLLALALVLALLGGAALAEVKTTGNVWLRSGPGLSYSQITSFSKGRTLTYLGESSVDERGVTWYKVSSGRHTGWVSSRYSKLVGETERNDAAEAPAPEPAPTPEPAQTRVPNAQDVLEAGTLFVDSVSAAPEASPSPLPVNGAVERSAYYLEDLVAAARELGLISYRQVQSEAPYQYYNDALIVAGNRDVENIVISGEGYALFGVRVGMNANTAAAFLNAAGLDYISALEGVTYAHRGAENSHYVNEQGHDSCVNLSVDENNLVTEIDWSSYTG